MTTGAPPSSTVDVDYTQVPDKIQALLDKNSSPLCCLQCRIRPDTKLLICTRCKAASYCSKTCQKDHFKFHKNDCKEIKENLVSVESCRGVDSEESEDEEEDMFLQLRANGTMLRYAMAATADLYVQVGYRESDTVQAGRLYYKHALHLFLECWKHCKEEFYLRPARAVGMEDKLLMLIVLLGGDFSALEQWCMMSGSPRRIYFVDRQAFINRQDDVGLAVPLYAARLLTAATEMARHRQELEGLQVLQDEVLKNESVAMPNDLQHQLRTFVEGDLDADRTNDGDHYDIFEAIVPRQQPKSVLLYMEINSSIFALLGRGCGDGLAHVYQTIPLASRHFPQLMERGPMAVGDDDYWKLYQDFLMETPGAMDLLEEAAVACMESMARDG